MNARAAFWSRSMTILSRSPIAPTLPASDIGRAKAFYRDVLGFEVVAEMPETGEVMFRSGQDVLFLVYRSPSAGTNRATAAAWRVSDLGAVVAELKSRGVEFENYDLPGLKTVDHIAAMPDGTRVAWFKDTEGNILGIDQFPGSYDFG
jgi:catechol 2,3-dioxygenase-like lactoylglutathione lyase family enzyme